MSEKRLWKYERIYHTPRTKPNPKARLHENPMDGVACGVNGLNVWITANKRDVNCGNCLRILGKEVNHA